MNLQTLWYGRSSLRFMLAPLAGLFCFTVWLRRRAYRLGLRKRWRAPVPLLVVGNINIGGVGKTPLVIWLVRYLQAQGYRPGVVSRGYGGQARHWPQQVRADSDVGTVGDEAVLIAQQTGVPMAVAPDRVAAVQALLEHREIDLIVSDDGLQHYALERDLEIVVVDGVRRFGNGWCFPAGPLREPRKRLQDVDLVVNNGASAQTIANSAALRGRSGTGPRRGEFAMIHRPGMARALLDDERVESLAAFKGQTVHAVAGIGNPQRFFQQLRGQGLSIEAHSFADHHAYQASDLQFHDSAPILMTGKDAVKCRTFADHRMWSVELELELDKVFATRLDSELGSRGIRPRSPA